MGRRLGGFLPSRSARASRGILSAPALVPAGSRWGSAPFVLSASVALASALVGLAGGTPLAGGDYDGAFAAGSGAVFVLAAAAAVRTVRPVPSRVRRWVAAGVVAFVAAFSWGASTQVVVDGAPSLVMSDTARSYALAEELLADLYRMSEFDVLLGYDDATARANLREFDPAAEELETIAARWATLEIADLPDGRFGPIIRNVYTSADFGAQALRARRNLILQYDPRTAAAVDSYRATFIRELLTAGPLLAELVESMGFDLVPAEGGAVE